MRELLEAPSKTCGDTEAEEVIKAGQTIRFKPCWMDPGDESVTFVATDDESKGRVTVEARLGLPINPTQVVKTDWIENDFPLR